MLGLKEAIKKAFEYFRLIYDDRDLPNTLLEEVEYDDASGVWKVVIGFDSDHITKRVERSTSGTMFGSPATVEEKERKYKQIRLKGQDGSFVKMTEEML